MSDNTNPDVSDKDLEIAAFIREQMGQHGWEGEKSRINPFILGTLEVDSAVGAKRGSAQWQHWKKDQVYSIVWIISHQRLWNRARRRAR
jgi:hypothetical protein